MLLCEAHMVASHVIPEYCDTAMQHILDKRFDPRKQPNIDGWYLQMYMDKVPQYMVEPGSSGMKMPNFANVLHVDTIRLYACLQLCQEDTRKLSLNITDVTPRNHSPNNQDLRIVYRPLNGAAANTTIQDVDDVLIDNRILPAWIDHGYTYGLNFINFNIANPSYCELLDMIDNERHARLRAYGTPPAILEWDRWRYPLNHDIASARHGFVNPRGLPGMGKPGTGMG